MNRDQRSVVCKRIDSIASARCEKLVRERDAAIAALPLPVVKYLEMLKKSTRMREDVLKKFMAELELAGKPEADYSRYVQLQLCINPDTVAGSRGQATWQPKEYPALCREYIEARNAISDNCKSAAARVREQAEKLKVKIILLGMPEAVLRMLENFENGIDTED